MTTRTAIVLAAGLGIRMGGPKVRLMTPEGALISRWVDRLGDGGCSSIIIATRPEHVDAVDRALAASCAADSAVRVTGIESPEPAATLVHALGFALQEGLLKATVLVTPVDTIP